MQLNTLTFDQLGGVQTGRALTDFYPFEALEAIGGFFDVSGAYTKRKGGQRVANVVTGKISGIYDFRFSNDTQQDIIFTAGGSIFRLDGSPTSLRSGLSVNGVYDFTDYNNLLFMANGVNNLQYYNGTSVFDVGITAPPSGMIAVGNAVGGTIQSGSYEVAITFVNNVTGVESNPSPTVSVTVPGADANNSITLTALPVSADPEVNERRVYLSPTNGVIADARVALTINSFDLNATIVAPGTGRLIEFDHDVPPAGLKGIEEFKDKLFAFESNRLRFTKTFFIDRPDNIFYWPDITGPDQEVNFVVNIGDSAPITGLKRFFDVLLIFKRNDLYALSGDNELNFRLNRLRTDEQAGAISNRAIEVVDNYCYFIGDNSIYRTDGITVQNIGEDIKALFARVGDPARFKIEKLILSQAVSVYDKENNNLVFFVPTGGNSENNTGICLDTNSIQTDPKSGKIMAKWSLWTGRNVSAAGVVFDQGNFFWYRGNEDGDLFKEETIDGDGAEITSTATGGNAGTLIDTNQSFTNNALIRFRIKIIRGKGAGQEREIILNTNNTIFVSPNWTEIPDTTSIYTIGGIEYSYQHGFDSYGEKSLSKRWRYARPRLETNGSYTVELSSLYDFSGVVDSVDYAPVLFQGASLWDVALWDVGIWDGIATQVPQDLVSIPGGRIHRYSSFKIFNEASGEPIKYSGVDKLFHMKGYR